MGSHLSFKEAAARLGCSTRTVHNHVQRGYLTKSIQNNKVVLRRDEVEQLATATGVDLPVFNRQNFYMLMAKVQRLEQVVGVLQRALDVRDNPLRPDKEQSQQLFASAIASLSVGHWTDDHIKTWTTVFDRFDEVTLDMLSEHLASKEGYEPFFKLCLAMMREVATRDTYETTLELQMLHKRLDEGRKRLRDTVLMWLKIRQGTLPETLMDKLESDKGALFKRLTPGAKTSRAKE